MAPPLSILWNIIKDTFFPNLTTLIKYKGSTSNVFLSANGSQLSIKRGDLCGSDVVSISEF